MRFEGEGEASEEAAWESEGCDDEDMVVDCEVRTMIRAACLTSRTGAPKVLTFPPCFLRPFCPRAFTSCHQIWTGIQKIQRTAMGTNVRVIPWKRCTDSDST